MKKLLWESFSFVPGMHSYHEYQPGGDMFAHDMSGLRADRNGYLRQRGRVRDTEIENVSGVASDPRYFWYISSGELHYRALDGSGATGTVVGISGLGGRLWVVSEFRDFIIIKSESNDHGYWIDLREDSDTRFDGYPLGIAPSTSTFQSSPHSFDGERLVTGFAYVFRMTFVRDFATRADVLDGIPSVVPELFEGVESDLGEPVIYYTGAITGTASRVRFVDKDDNEISVVETGIGNNVVVFTNLVHSVDSQVTGIKLYQSEAIEYYQDETINIDNLVYRSVDYRSRDADNQALGVGVRSSSEQWPNQIEARKDNHRLPMKPAQIAYYNDLVVAAVGDGLRYSDFRDGAPVQWAFPEANSIRVEGEVLFCVEYRGVLLFGGPHGIWRLTGTGEFNFNRDNISAVGPVSRGAFAKFENGIGFVSAAGFYITNGVEVQKVSSPHLDGFFEENAIVDGSVTLLPTNDELWAVELGDGMKRQFIKSIRGGWFGWEDVDVSQSTRFVEVDSDGNRSEQVYCAEEGASLREVLWDDFSIDTALPWSWMSNVIDFKSEGHQEALKTYRWLEVSSEHDGEGTLRIWLDGEMEPTDIDFDFVADTHRPVRIPINLRGNKLQFEILGTGDVVIRYLRLLVETRSRRTRY